MLEIYLEKLSNPQSPIELNAILWSVKNGNTAKNKIATCLYKTRDGEALEPAVINEILKGIEGINIENETAVLQDFSKFGPRSLGRTVGKKPVKNTLFAPSINHSMPEIKLIKSTVFELDKLNFMSLIADCKGQTAVYFKDLPDNHKTSFEQLLKLQVYSPINKNILTQVIARFDYYFLRQQQIRLIEQLFEEDIIPAIKDFEKNNTHISGTILNYFTQAVLKIMNNFPLQSTPTAFEVNFHKNKVPVPAERNYQIRHIIAEEMLEPLSYFVENLPVSKTKNQELMSWLQDFKTYLSSDANIKKFMLNEKYQTIFRAIKELILCTALVDNEYSLIETDSLKEENPFTKEKDCINYNLLKDTIKQLKQKGTTLHLALNSKDAIFLPEQLVDSTLPKLYSLKAIISYFYKINPPAESKKLESKSNELLNLAEDLINSSVTLFSECKNVDKSSNISELICKNIVPTNSDVYLTEKWKNKLENNFLNTTANVCLDEWQSHFIDSVSAIRDEMMSIAQVSNESELVFSR